MKCGTVAFDTFRSDKAKGERQSCALDGHSCSKGGPASRTAEVRDERAGCGISLLLLGPLSP